MTFARDNRLLRVLALLVVALLCMSLLPSVADASKESEAAAVRAQMEDVKDQLSRAGRAYDEAFWALDETESSIERLDGELEQTRAELDVAQLEMNERLTAMYRSDPADYLTVLLGATSFQDMVTRVEYLQRIGRSDAQVVTEYRELRAKLEADRGALQQEFVVRSERVDDLQAVRDSLQSKFQDIQAEYGRLQKELDRIYGGTVGTPGANGMTFPVQGAHYYSDTWGASRSGGRRTHQGTDVMAAAGTPCVAVLSGTVQTKSSSLGGQTIWLTADNGWKFYYAHLQSYAVTSGRVRAGQVIGYVGSTGNASASSPHLHFQIHPNGGSAVNPYPYLRAMQR